MIKLAIAVGFLAVFGFVAYAAIVVLTDYVKSKRDKDKDETKTK